MSLEQQIKWILEDAIQECNDGKNPLMRTRSGPIEPKLWKRKYEWRVFKQKCARRFRTMRADDMDREKLKEVIVDCRNWSDVYKLVKEYNETYFREMIHTFRYGEQ